VLNSTKKIPLVEIPTGRSDTSFRHRIPKHPSAKEQPLLYNHSYEDAMHPER